jgi:hypothetical protein
MYPEGLTGRVDNYNSTHGNVRGEVRLNDETFVIPPPSDVPVHRQGIVGHTEELPLQFLDVGLEFRTCRRNLAARKEAEEWLETFRSLGMHLHGCE